MASFYRNWLEAYVGCFIRDDRAITSIEYGLVVMVVSSIVFIFVQDLGSQKLWEILQGISTGFEELLASQG